MAKRYIKVIALLVAVCVSMCGCSGIMDMLTDELFYEGGILGYLERDSEEWVNFRDMEYVRPDMDHHDEVLAESCRLAAEAGNVDEIVEGVYAYYDEYDRCYTNYSLADIHYSMDLSDSYWEAEYEFCSGCIASVDAGLEQLYMALADSPYLEELESEEYFGEGFFDGYQGEETQWDSEFIALVEKEAELEYRYYALSGQAAQAEYYSEEYFSTYGAQMEQLLVELVLLRQQIAREAGFDSYPEYAYTVEHYRDFSPQQAKEYMEQIGQILTPLYRQYAQGEIRDWSLSYSGEYETFRFVKTVAENMGGVAQEAFDMMEQTDTFDLSYGENKYDGSFEVYLYSYYQPYVFISPCLDQTDKLIFAHEFGHFVNDYICWGSTVGTDVAEVQSQGMEYMSVCYSSDSQLEKYKLLDCLSTYVEQASYALFELEIYSLPEDQITVENFRAINQRIGDTFGMGVWEFDSRDYVTLSHYFTDPMYVPSYVVSNDVAFQIYQLEKQQEGAGLAVYESCLESMDSYIIGFAESCGLESPFAPGRLEKVKASLEEGLQ